MPMPAGIVWAKVCSSAFITWPELYPGVRNDGDLRSSILVEARCEFRAGRASHRSDRAQWNSIAVGRGNVELPNVIDVRPRVAFGFDVGLPLSAESVEVVHQRSAHEGLHRGVDVREVNLLLRRLFAIDVDVKLRYGRSVRGNGRGNLRTILRARQGTCTYSPSGNSDRRCRSGLPAACSRRPNYPGRGSQEVERRTRGPL